MFKSKHSGWTYDLKRTPFGGGNPLDSASHALGTDGSGGGALGALASIDPGPAIGSGLAQLDKGVNQIPGGWYTVGALAAGGTGLYFAPELAAAAGLGEGAAITSEIGQQAFFDALASGASSTEAISAGAAADAAVAAGAGAGVADAVTSTPGADAVLNSSTNIANLTPPGAGNFGSIVAPSAGAITNGAGLTGAIGAGTMVGDGTLGTTIGQTYMAAGPGQFALDASGAAIPAGAGGIAGTTPSGMSASDIFNNAKRAKNLADALKQGAASGLSNSLGKLAQGANPQGQALTAVVRGNQNPFSYAPQQPIQDTRQAQLASLLKQG